jgi:transposase InsO family protein
VRPWQSVATDLFVWNITNYVLVVDYYSNYFEIAQLANTKSSTVIQHIKSMFARYGIPEVLISDNGPQYSSEEFRQFATTWGFIHKTGRHQHARSQMT